ncbi:MAG: hypothetical protein KC418_19030 [Anaerolineales bacterium]|nr:hypothetical protein [Anaerolineales bacterium]MCB8951017.1 hypothetical protein [Ardenticatenales bacterium]
MLSSKLRRKIVQFIENAITIEELEDWYVARLPLLLIDPHSTDSDLVSAIELGLAELNAGIRDENNLRHFLEEALRQAAVSEAISFSETEKSEKRVAY